MKYIHSDGKRMVVRDIGDELWQAEGRLKAPLPIITHKIVSDDEARESIKSIISMGLYTCRSLKDSAR